jgi:hypothetical protein
MSRLPSIGVTVCNTRSGLNTSRAAGPLCLCAAPLARALPRFRRLRHWLTTLPFIKAAITTGVPSTGVCHGFLSAQNLFCYTSSALGLALESGTSGRANVELSY